MTLLDPKNFHPAFGDQPDGSDDGPTIPSPEHVPERAGSACSYVTDGETCGCSGYVEGYATYCATCDHSRSFHW
jgi:hypothetical protein